MLIDTHAHLYFDQLTSQLEDVLKRASEVGITDIINIGVDLETSLTALTQAQNFSGNITKHQNPLEALEEKEWEKSMQWLFEGKEILHRRPMQDIRIHSTIGMHPHDAQDSLQMSDAPVEEIIQKLKMIYEKDPKKVVAVGECGLDFYEPVILNEVKNISFANTQDDKSNVIARSDNDEAISHQERAKELQRKLLTAQVELAKELNLPLIVHCRDSASTSSVPSAWDEIFDFIKDVPKGVFHCYSGDAEITHRILTETNFLVSYACNITYPKNDVLRDTIKQVPMDRIVVETDAPFLAPQKKRGTTNEPAYVVAAAECIAAVRGMNFDEVSHITTENAKRLFNLS